MAKLTDACSFLNDRHELPGAKHSRFEAAIAKSESHH
jgi:hypothetical protein